MNSRITGHIAFTAQQQLRIQLSTEAKNTEEKELMLMIYTWFALRILATTGPTTKTTLEQLMRRFVSFGDPEEFLKGQGITYLSFDGDKAKKGFIFEIEMHGTGFLTKNRPYGFGILGREVGYCAPIAVVCLLAFLLEQYSDDTEFSRELLYATDVVSAWSMYNPVSVMAEQQITFMIRDHWRQQDTSSDPKKES